MVHWIGYQPLKNLDPELVTYLVATRILRPQKFVRAAMNVLQFASMEGAKLIREDRLAQRLRTLFIGEAARESMLWGG